MAHFGDQVVLPFKQASLISQYVAVRLDTVDQQVMAATDSTVLPIGLSIATGASIGNGIAVAIAGVAKARAAASVGFGSPVGVSSVNGALGPIAASGLSTALGSALGAGGAKYQVGLSLHAAAAGDYFAVLLDPRQIV